MSERFGGVDRYEVWKEIRSLDLSYLPKNYCMIGKKAEESKGKG